MAKETYFYDSNVLREVSSEAHEPDQVTVHTAQNLDQVTDLVKQMREEHQVIGHRKSRNMVPIAEIPMIEYERAFREGWVNDPKAWKKWLNDPRNKAFRITDGRA
jgi:hypothetical protein